MLVLRNIVKEDQNEKGKFILDNVNFHLETKEYVEIIGKDNLALASLTKIVTLIERDYQGEYYFERIQVNKLDEKELNDLRINNIGLVMGHLNLINELTLEENLELPFLYKKKELSSPGFLSDQMLQKFNLTHRRSHYPVNLSPFMKLKAAIAQALTLEPKLLILEYDCRILSFEDQLELTHLLFGLNEEGLTILALINDETTSLAYRKLYLSEGKMYSE